MSAAKRPQLGGETIRQFEEMVSELHSKMHDPTALFEAMSKHLCTEEEVAEWRKKQDDALRQAKIDQLISLCDKQDPLSSHDIYAIRQLLAAGSGMANSEGTVT